MNDLSQSSGKAPAAERKAPLMRMLRLLIKQTAAALVFAVILLTMHGASTPAVNKCGAALDAALKHESDISKLSHFLSDTAANIHRILTNVETEAQAFK